MSLNKRWKTAWGQYLKRKRKNTYSCFLNTDAWPGVWQKGCTFLSTGEVYSLGGLLYVDSTVCPGPTSSMGVHDGCVVFLIGQGLHGGLLRSIVYSSFSTQRVAWFSSQKTKTFTGTFPRICYAAWQQVLEDDSAFLTQRSISKSIFIGKSGWQTSTMMWQNRNMEICILLWPEWFWQKTMCGGTMTQLQYN